MVWPNATPMENVEEKTNAIGTFQIKIDGTKGKFKGSNLQIVMH